MTSPVSIAAAQGKQLVVFRLHGQRHALPLAVVERVFGAAAVTPLPGAPEAVLGALDVGGRIVPVYGLRRRFGAADRPLEPADQFLLVRTPRRLLVLVVDEVQDVVACDLSGVPADTLASGLEAVAGVVRLDGELLLIHDVERFLSPPEEQALEAALDRAA